MSLSRFLKLSNMKLKERILIAIMAGVILLTVVLVLDIETKIQSPKQRTASHGKVHYNSFRHRHLQKTSNGSREAASHAAQVSAGDDGMSHQGGGPNDQVVSGAQSPPVNDADNMINTNNDYKKSSTSPPDPYDDLVSLVIKIEELSKRNKKHRRHWNPSLGELLGLQLRENSTMWDHFHLSIARDELYQKKDPVIPALLRDVATRKITHITQKEGGTQLKLIIEFDDGGHALFKPMRFTREMQTLKNHFYFTDFERHNAEIAAFHLDRLLGFRRGVPVIGRTLNMTKELYALAQGDLLKTFFISPDNNLCFHGKCSYYCDTAHAICGNPDLLEGSFALFLPGKDAAPRKVWRHPWRRSYHKRRKAQWEVDDAYCDLVKAVHPYNEGRRLLDVIDMSILDFLMGNMDRHHYETFKMFGNNSAPIHLDHGRAFGKPFHDEISILAPLIQCCHIRHSTLATLLRHQGSPKRLGGAMRDSLAWDPISPVLWEPHLEAMDRRLNSILQEVRVCVAKANNPMEVVINDFH